jgi:hypothetical protein
LTQSIVGHRLLDEFFIQLAGNSMQIFTSEVFPTNARASGFGLAQSDGPELRPHSRQPE